MPPLWLIYAIIAMFCVGVTVAVVVIATKKGKGVTDSNISLSVSVINPINQTKEKTILIANSLLSKINVENFISNILNNFKEVFPEYRYIFWKSIRVNNVNIPVDNNGEISDTVEGKTISSLLSLTSFPPNIPVVMQFSRACPLDEKNLLKCDPCKGEAPICSPTGWICKPGQVCATGAAMYECCKDSPNGPYATCGADKNITCGPCPGMETACAALPPCSGFGPVCTATGPVCIPSAVCPPKETWGSCMKCPEGSFVTCVNGVFSCEECETPAGFTCPESCSMNGPKCDKASGTMKCMPGVKYPTSQDVLKSCCTDPKFPVPYRDDRNNKVGCKNCDNIPKPKDDPNQGLCDNGSCQGHGWVCTGTGWICKPGVRCPPPEIAAKCCPDTNPTTSCSADTNFCVTCSCPGDTVSCGTSFCSSETPSQCQKTCCQAESPCQKDPSTGECICCSSPDKVCHLENSAIPVCCGPGLVCKNRNCVATCGPVTCAPGQECGVIRNVTDQAKATLAQEYPNAVNFIQNDAYICMNPSSCTPGNETALPAAIDNYYPCMPLPLDSTTGKPGYCVENVCYQKDVNSCNGVAVAEVPGGNISSGVYDIKVYDSATDTLLGYLGFRSNKDTWADGSTLLSVSVNPTSLGKFYVKRNGDIFNIGLFNNGVVPADSSANLWLTYNSTRLSVGNAGTLVNFTPSSDKNLNTFIGSTPIRILYDPLGKNMFYFGMNQDPLSTKPIYFRYYKNETCVWDSANQYCKSTSDVCSYSNAADCGSSGFCTWRDIVKFMAAGDMSTQAEKMQKELNIKYDTREGNYCDPGVGGQIFSRVVGYKMGDNCTWDQCWTEVAQPGVVDIFFDQNTKSCVALQNCNGTANMQSDKKFPVANDSAFPLCSTVSQCPYNLENNNLYCLPAQGKLSDPRYYCKPLELAGTQCQLDLTGNSTMKSPQCNSTCDFPCDPSKPKGTTGGCY